MQNNFQKLIQWVSEQIYIFMSLSDIQQFAITVFLVEMQFKMDTA